MSFMDTIAVISLKQRYSFEHNNVTNIHPPQNLKSALYFWFSLCGAARAGQFLDRRRPGGLTNGRVPRAVHLKRLTWHAVSGRGGSSTKGPDD